ncbi:TIGR04452 family lipoprotein [Leptospira langatensis]|uniref:TIGR04452 family lipoprotein n=1 Tax=Leptospira langatensis TaxID=2484983 RepID=A0A5F1ZUV5_9LEPT|nr:TIGR04452 family lipoprotein [Leptospira langatensis]TGK01305.1 TIGR04452 family lipoprotein [Leptospira langatensis]TGL42243.1 TIGR04452 family lipoprotein [Leptospira langatensis]
MKRISTITILLLMNIAINCLIVDATGLTNTYKGDEAKRRIINAAKSGDYLTAHAAFAAQGYTGSDLELMTLVDILLASAIDGAVINIDSSRYYKKGDVHACEVQIALLGVQLDTDSFSTYLFSPACELHPDGEIIDENMGGSNSRYKKKKEYL